MAAGRNRRAHRDFAWPAPRRIERRLHLVHVHGCGRRPGRADRRILAPHDVVLAREHERMAGKAATAPARVTISKLGRTFGLARSTLLYYDRIGILRPTGRTRAGYRLYGTDTVERLKRISELRAAGLPLKSVK